MRDLIRRIQRWSLKHIGRGPIVTSVTHAIVTVLGLVPVPIGLAGIVYFWITTHSWLWIVTGIRPATFLERYDTWLDVFVPTFAYGVQLGLLGWLL